MLQNTGKRARRRAYPIKGYVGPNGSGKSACMVWDTLPSLEAGRPVLSTVRLLDYTNPRECEGCDEPGHYRPVYGPVMVEELERAELTDEQRQALRDEFVSEAFNVSPVLTHDALGFPVREVVDYVTHRAAHPLYVPFTKWEQLLEARSCDVLMDEVTGVASSRESQSMPAPVANTLVQLRRADVVLRWSAPAWARADKIARECSQSVTYCRGYLAKRAEGGDRLWRQRRLFKWQTFDATEFEDFTASKRDNISTLVTDWHWGPRSPSFAAYDTFDAVSSIGTVTDAGRCYRCGGKREPHRCKCGQAHRESASAPEGGRPEAARRGAAPSQERVSIQRGEALSPVGTDTAIHSG